MSLVSLHLRAIRLIGRDARLAAGLAGAAIVLAFMQFAEPILFGRVVDALSKDQPALPLVAIWAGFGFASVAANIVIALQADRLAHRRRLTVMKQFFEHVIALPASFHSQTQSGRLIGIMLRGTDSLFQFWLALFREDLTAVVILVVMLPTALMMNWQMGSLLVGLMALYWALSSFVVRQTTVGQSRAADYHSELSGRVGDVIGNVGVVQSFGRQAEEARAVEGIIANVIRAQFPVLTWWAMTTVMTRGAATITIIALFALGAMLHAAGEISVGEIVSFVGFATLLIGRLDQLAHFLSRIVFNAANLRQFFDVLDERGTLVDAPGAPALQVGRGHVVFDSVAFRYPGAASGIADISFEARPGETVAIVGPTGSGKTTTLALLQRVRDPSAGRILIDGQDLRAVTLASVRNAIGVVFQEAGLFNRSIRDNIAIGRPDATEAEIARAAASAEADSFIRLRPEGYGMIVGERGQGLSGGERQRLAIARAILKDAPILILDEATSALDNETEAKVKRALARLAAGRTTFVIAHRLSTVTKADLILVMEAGRIVERGTFADLIARGGRFAALVAAGDFAEEDAIDPTPAATEPPVAPPLAPTAAQ